MKKMGIDTGPKRKSYPSQWVAGLVLIAAAIQDVELATLLRRAGISRRAFRRVVAGERGMTLDEASRLSSALGLDCSVLAEMTLTNTHERLMAVTMAVEPPPGLAATRPEAA